MTAVSPAVEASLRAMMDRLLPIIGPLPLKRRARAVALMLEAVRDGNVDAAAVDRLAGEIRRRFCRRRS
jgi:hypothetical protein